MNHTPGPWETRELSNGDWAISQKGAPTAHTTVHTWNGKEESATAQFIVQACNAHEELVGILQKLSRLAPSSEGLGGHAPLSAFIQLASDARKALASIEKGV